MATQCKCCRQDFKAEDPDQVVCEDCRLQTPDFASLTTAYAQGERLTPEEEEQLLEMQEEQEQSGLPF